MRVLFAGTPDFSVPALKALLAENDVIGVYTQPDRRAGRGKNMMMSPVKQLALEQNITVYQPDTLGNQGDTIAALNPDVFVVVAYGMLLPQNILDIPKLGCINIHASILPRWRGAAPIQRAIQAGDKQTGVSIMQMEAGLDTGPVFQTLTTEISAQDTSQSLHDRLARLGAQGICKTLSDLESELKDGKALTHAVPQRTDSATYAKKISKKEAQIDWQADAESIQCQIRAFNPWPVCQTLHKQTRLRIWQSSIVSQPKENNSYQAGTIIDIDEEGITVACGMTQETALKLEILQRDGSRPLRAREFMNGYKFNIGDILQTP